MKTRNRGWKALRTTGAGVLYLACTALSVSSAAQEVPADCPERPSMDQEARKLAGYWFSKGEEYAFEKRYVEALESFYCSLRMVEHPATLFNAAQAARFAGDRKAALRLLRRFIEISPQGEFSDEAKARIDELKEVERREQEAAKAAGHGSAERDRARELKAKGRTLSIAGYTTLGGGAAIAVVGAVLQGLAAKAAGDDAAEAETLDEYNDLKQERDDYQVGAIVGFAVGGAAVGAGIAMAVLGVKIEAQGESKVALSLRPGPEGLTLVGKF